jgi:hypothetical protein
MQLLKLDDRQIGELGFDIRLKKRYQRTENRRLRAYSFAWMTPQNMVPRQKRSARRV